MRVLDFVARYHGQYLTAPGGAGRQCVDLANQYLIDVWGLAEVHANAVDWPHAQIAGWRWTANSPANAPGLSALVVWGPYAAHEIGVFGHIALALAANTATLITFDQNWPDGSPCMLTVHDYGGVLGWWELP